MKHSNLKKGQKLTVTEPLKSMFTVPSLRLLALRVSLLHPFVCDVENHGAEADVLSMCFFGNRYPYCKATHIHDKT